MNTKESKGPGRHDLGCFRTHKNIEAKLQDSHSTFSHATKNKARYTAGGQGLYLRSFDHLSRSSDAKNDRNPLKVKCDRRTDRQMDGQMDQQSRV